MENEEVGKHNVLLSLNSISKSFGATKALEKVSFDVEKGESRAIVGENGAGKSTLMNIISGVINDYNGKIFFDNKAVQFKSARESEAAGIGFVHQELALCPDVSVAENIFMSHLPCHNLGFINFKKLYVDAEHILSSFTAQIDPRETVKNLSVAEQQIVEIAKVLSNNCRLIIFDEPTSALTDKEAHRLFNIIDKLHKNNISILYISHRMQEIFSICENITILRDGQFIDTVKTNKITKKQVISKMVGRQLGTLFPTKGSSTNTNKCLLSVKNASRKKYFNDISFDLYSNEILGFSGLIGSGRSELMRSLCGIDPLDRGKIALSNQNFVSKSYRQAIDCGFCYVTEDRKTDGLFLDMSVKNNICVSLIDDVSSKGFINQQEMVDVANKQVQDVAIKISNLEAKVRSLSGGNQQKVLIGKWLAINPKVIVMDEPTRGIDVGAKAEIYQQLRRLADMGKGVILISSELSEIIGLCDRVVVMHEGHNTGILMGDKINEKNIMLYASGEK